MPAYCFDFNVYQQANVNMVIRSWQHYRRFLGAISFLYHHNTIIHARMQEIFVGFGGGGVQARLTEKKNSDVFFFFVCFVIPQFYLQRESSDYVFFKENYH